MQELDEPAKEAGVTLLNEIGLDPGIDHMLAMQCIDEVHDKGGKVMPTYSSKETNCSRTSENEVSFFVTFMRNTVVATLEIVLFV